MLSLSLETPKAEPDITLLPDGRVLLKGGWNDAGDLESPEVIDPGYWSVGADSEIDHKCLARDGAKPGST